MRFSGFVERWKGSEWKCFFCADLCKNRKSFVMKWITFAWSYNPLRALAAVDICTSDRTSSHSEGNWLSCSVWIHLCSSLSPPKAYSQKQLKNLKWIYSVTDDGTSCFDTSFRLNYMSAFAASFIGWSGFSGLKHFLFWYSGL